MTRRLLLVHAYPADEATSTGATMALATHRSQVDLANDLFAAMRP